MSKIKKLFENVNTDVYNYIETNRKYEGGNTPHTFHVPNNKGVVIGKSGVTNREGIDFGQQSKNSLKEWGVPDYLVNKVEHALGVRGEEAMKIDLDLSEDESKMISKKYLEHSDKQLSELFDTYKSADPKIKSELLQLRTHNYRLGSKVAAVLNKPYKNQKKLANDLANAIKQTNKGDKNRINKTVQALKGFINGK